MKFNASEFPFPILFPTSSIPKVVPSSLGYSIDFHQPIVSSPISSMCHGVAQSPLVSTLARSQFISTSS